MTKICIQNKDTWSKTTVTPHASIKNGDDNNDDDDLPTVNDNLNQCFLLGPRMIYKEVVTNIISDTFKDLKWQWPDLYVIIIHKAAIVV